jgi:NRPS condensation-like uncharacterized protein
MWTASTETTCLNENSKVKSNVFHINVQHVSTLCELSAMFSKFNKSMFQVVYRELRYISLTSTNLGALKKFRKCTHKGGEGEELAYRLPITTTGEYL